ncbi:Receptor-like serine/threonine-protein kinase SD1-8 [Camellia lanceoleosa]|uniref:Receptor-like serine/threonine-protein kinase SD1-8 n=1 Tax=Camellia lanceoleosa TaxID=1840588 RepID=A0ACC0GFG4_9ERIC|nr:Receptor-like serine/threonine-protein kinase SD1-8 [Camellia lanceoleosa]
MVLYQESTVNYRGGSWDGVRFGGDPPLHTKAVVDNIFIINSTDVYYCFKNTDDTAISRLKQEWDRGDWSGGCVRRTPVNCSAPQGFRKLPGLKLPDSLYFLVDMTKMSLVDCKEACLRNCTCVAFALTSVSGCVVWFGELLDMKEFSEHGQDLYIRMAASDLGSNKKNKRTAMITSIIVISGVLVLSLIGWYFLKELHVRRDVPQRLPS